MNELVQKIVKQTYSDYPDSIEEIKGKGKNNLVFKVGVNNRLLILRLNNSIEANELYKKEKWCAEEARKTGVLTPKIYEVGIFDKYAFSFQEYIEGIRGTEALNDLERIWFTLGEYARIINKIPAQNLELNYKRVVQEMFAGNYFEQRNILTKELSEKIQSRLEETFAWKFEPRLSHGNLHPNNVVVKNPSGDIYLIDWETATGNLTPPSELAEIYTWNTGKENLEYFLNGYDLDENQVEKMMREIQTLILLRLVNVIIRRMPKNNDWSQDDFIKETSMKLANISDYMEDILFTKNL